MGKVKISKIFMLVMGLLILSSAVGVGYYTAITYKHIALTTWVALLFIVGSIMIYGSTEELVKDI
jgi:hypothetical protein